jgi:hypothetical protein
VYGPAQAVGIVNLAGLGFARSHEAVWDMAAEQFTKQEAGPHAGALTFGMMLQELATAGISETGAKGGVVRACLRRADAVWLVANARRAVNDKTVKDALLRPFRRRLVAGAGRASQLPRRPAHLTRLLWPPSRYSPPSRAD